MLEMGSILLIMISKAKRRPDRDIRWTAARPVTNLSALCVPGTARVLKSESNVVDFQTFGKS